MAAAGDADDDTPAGVWSGLGRRGMEEEKGNERREVARTMQ